MLLAVCLLPFLTSGGFRRKGSQAARVPQRGRQRCHGRSAICVMGRRQERPHLQVRLWFAVSHAAYFHSYSTMEITAGTDSEVVVTLGSGGAHEFSETDPVRGLWLSQFGAHLSLSDVCVLLPTMHGACPNRALSPIAVRAVHEVGHVLGMGHTQSRHDAPRFLYNCAVVRPVPALRRRASTFRCLACVWAAMYRHEGNYGQSPKDWPDVSLFDYGSSHSCTEASAFCLLPACLNAGSPLDLLLTARPDGCGVLCSIALCRLCHVVPHGSGRSRVLCG